MKHSKRKKLEFSKVLTFMVMVVLFIYSIWCGIEYYRLTRMAIELNTSMPDVTLAVTCVTSILAALVSYCLYQFGLKNSRNKYGITADGEPFVQQSEAADMTTVDTAELDKELSVLVDYDVEKVDIQVPELDTVSEE